MLNAKRLSNPGSSVSLYLKSFEMSLKRPSDSVAVIPDVKRTRQDVELYNNRDKQLLESVNRNEPL